MLTEYEQQVRLIAGDTYTQQVFIGASPFLVAEPETFQVLIQQGSAVGWNQIFTPPVPLFPEALLEKKDVSYQRGDTPKWITRWRYVMAVAADYAPDLSVVSAWPTAPTFVTAPL